MSLSLLKFVIALALVGRMAISCENIFATCPSEYVDVHGNCTKPATTFGNSPTLCPYGQHRDTATDKCVAN